MTSLVKPARGPSRLPLLAAVTLVITAVWVATPPTASAHAVGSDPVATAYRATIGSVPTGVAAAVVDGDQRIWMAANPRLTVVVKGLLGEPFLRFSRGGVDQNLNSPTAYLNRAIPGIPPAGLARTLPPRWSRLTTGHSYVWHEDRLHALARSGFDHASWMIPMTVDGRAQAITGSLNHVPTPSRLWFWPELLLAACVPALLRLRSQPLTRAVTRVLGVSVAAAVGAGRVGVGLHGHPTVSASQIAWLVCVIAAVCGAVYLLLRGSEDVWQAAAFGLGALGVYQGLVLAPTLTDGDVLLALPATAGRVAAMWSFGAGTMLMIAVVCIQTTGRRSDARAGSARRGRGRPIRADG